MTVDGLTAEIDDALQFPGVKAHIGMLLYPHVHGVKVIGTDLVEIDKLAKAY